MCLDLTVRPFIKNFLCDCKSMLKSHDQCPIAVQLLLSFVGGIPSVFFWDTQYIVSENNKPSPEIATTWRPCIRSPRHPPKAQLSRAQLLRPCHQNHFNSTLQGTQTARPVPKTATSPKTQNIKPPSPPFTNMQSPQLNPTMPGTKPRPIANRDSCTEHHQCSFKFIHLKAQN